MKAASAAVVAAMRQGWWNYSKRERAPRPRTAHCAPHGSRVRIWNISIFGMWAAARRPRGSCVHRAPAVAE